MIKACKCAAMVHPACLERWLNTRTQTGHACEASIKLLAQCAHLFKRFILSRLLWHPELVDATLSFAGLQGQLQRFHEEQSAAEQDV